MRCVENRFETVSMSFVRLRARSTERKDYSNSHWVDDNDDECEFWSLWRILSVKRLNWPEKCVRFNIFIFRYNVGQIKKQFKSTVKITPFSTEKKRSHFHDHFMLFLFLSVTTSFRWKRVTCFTLAKKNLNFS